MTYITHMAQTPTTYDNRTGNCGPHGTIEGWTPQIGMTVTVITTGHKGQISRIDWNGTLLVTDGNGKSQLSDWFRVTTH